MPFDYTHVGVPVSRSDTVAVYVSMEPYSRDPLEQKQHAPPIASPALVLEGITSGYRALPSGVQVTAADESLRSACFVAGAKYTPVEGPARLLPVAELSRSECRALVAERGIRYIVSVAGFRWTGQQEGQQWASTAFVWETPQTYSLTAQVLDATNGAVVCEASDHQAATSSVGAAWLYLPFPVFSAVDESAYWKRVAWNIGNKVRSCFLPLAATGSNE